MKDAKREKLEDELGDWRATFPGKTAADVCTGWWAADACAKTLMRVCYDEANRLANHCSDGAARRAMQNLYDAANAARKIVGYDRPEAGNDEAAVMLEGGAPLPEDLRIEKPGHGPETVFKVSFTEEVP